MADKKRGKGKKPSGMSLGGSPGKFGGQIGKVGFSAGFGGGIGLAGPGREVPPGGTPNAKKKANVPLPKLNPRRGNR